MCVGDFRKGIWRGRLQSLWDACLKVMWLFIALILASLVALILPLIGFFAVFGFVSSLFVYLTRKRVNPFVRRHLNRICKLDEILVHADGYQTQTGRWINLSSS
jgi:hypothetical protein